MSLQSALHDAAHVQQRETIARSQSMEVLRVPLRVNRRDDPLKSREVVAKQRSLRF